MHLNFIPKCFKVKNSLPGNFESNEARLKAVSIESIKDEKKKHENSLKSAKIVFEKAKLKLKDVFDDATAESELERIFEHIRKLKSKLHAKKNKKIER